MRRAILKNSLLSSMRGTIWDTKKKKKNRKEKKKNNLLKSFAAFKEFMIKLRQQTTYMKQLKHNLEINDVLLTLSTVEFKEGTESNTISNNQRIKGWICTAP